MNHRPYALLAELTYRCPLHCPYCSNPTASDSRAELSTGEWAAVLEEAASLGVLHLGLSGGEPLVRHDLEVIVSMARKNGLYTNLITSGIGLSLKRAKQLKEAGLQSLQLSLQADERTLADAIAGTHAHEQKLLVAKIVREAGLSLSMNMVIHRHNIEHLQAMIELAADLGAERLEVANVQYYGWAFLNRDHLLPSREQVMAAKELALVATQEYQGRMEIIYVLPDLYESRPKPCMHGWGRRYLTVRPNGEVLPCPTASSIPDLEIETVRNRSLRWIWNESPGFNRFRGTDWLPEPCQSCAFKEVDFGGCRCQAALLAGNAAATDPVCTLSPHRDRVDAILAAIPPSAHADATTPSWTRRVNPALGDAVC